MTNPLFSACCFEKEKKSKGILTKTHSTVPPLHTARERSETTADTHTQTTSRAGCEQVRCSRSLGGSTRKRERRESDGQSGMFFFCPLPKHATRLRAAPASVRSSHAHSATPTHTHTRITHREQTDLHSAHLLVGFVSTAKGGCMCVCLDVGEIDVCVRGVVVCVRFAVFRDKWCVGGLFARTERAEGE